MNSQIKAPIPAFCIRTMRAEEVQIAIDWAGEAGWNPGLNDATSFFAADPEGFFIAEIHGKPVGVAAAVKYSDTYGFFGLYIVHPEYRGRNIGFALTQARLAQMGNRMIGLDGVVEMQAKYAQIGFEYAYRNMRFQCNGMHTPDQPYFSRPDLVDLKSIPSLDLNAYDRTVFPAPREDFLKAWIHQPGAEALGFVESGTLKGYAVIRPCLQGYKVGPLYADSPEIAESLFMAMKTRVPADQCIILDIPELNPAAKALVEKHNMDLVFETARMYKNGRPEEPLDRIFGLTTYEIG